MARKKNVDEPAMSQSAAEPRPTRSDRHKPRRMVAVPPRIHDLLAELARRNKRPLLWEVRIALEKHLRDNGLLPPEDE